MSNTPRKAINFDFDTKILEENINNLQMGGTYRKAYSDIERYLKKHGFEHVQESSYTSKVPISYKKVLNLISDLTEQFPYMEGAFKSVITTSVNQTYDVTNLMNEEHDVKFTASSDLYEEHYKLKSFGIKPNDNSTNRKSIRFDFSGELLKEKYEEFGIESDIGTAYTVVKNYFKKLGYSHEQGSVYISNDKKTDTQILKDILEFAEQNPHLKGAFKSVQISNVKGQYDITDIANYGKDTVEDKKDKTFSKQIEFKIDNDNGLSFG